MSGKIHRIKKDREFAVLDTWALREPSLSWKAKGLHCYILQLPEDWELNIADLKQRSADGRDGTSSGVQELLDARLLFRFQCFDSEGRFDGYDYHCFERPEEATKWLLENGFDVTGKPVNGKPVNGKTVNGKPVTMNNEGNQVVTEPSFNGTKKETSAPTIFGFETEPGPAKKAKKPKPGEYTDADVANLLSPEHQIFHADILHVGAWQEYLKYRKEEHRFRYKKAESQALAVQNLYELSHGSPATALLIVRQSIANGWKGLFTLKTNANANRNNIASAGNDNGGSGFFGGGSEEFFTGVK